MKTTHALASAALVLALPAAAAAVSIDGDFAEGGAPAVVNTLTGGSGIFGQAEITTEGEDDIDLVFSFQVADDYAVNGIGNVRRVDFFDNLRISFNGSAVPVDEVGIDGLGQFKFPTTGFAAGDSFDIGVSWDQAEDDATIDFDVAAVPLPAGLWFGLTAMAGLGLVGRRRR